MKNFMLLITNTTNDDNEDVFHLCIVDNAVLTYETDRINDVLDVVEASLEERI